MSDEYRNYVRMRNNALQHVGIVTSEQEDRHRKRAERAAARIRAKRPETAYPWVFEKGMMLTLGCGFQYFVEKVIRRIGPEGEKYEMELSSAMNGKIWCGIWNAEGQCLYLTYPAEVRAPRDSDVMEITERDDV